MPAKRSEDERAEAERLAEAKRGVPWRTWGPYLSERQWGTVREDYSRDGAAWDYFPHDHARSRAYRWGEDGIAGYSDHEQRLCFSLALWNGRDAILKERLFGLTNAQGNHGEDVKELYYYTDATPTHAPTDTLIRIIAKNLGPESAALHLLPQLWFRNTWSWSADSERPHVSLGHGALLARDHKLGSYALYFEPGGEALFTDNDTNVERLFGDTRGGHFKDAFHEALVHGRREALRVDHGGTKSAVHYRRTLAPGASTSIVLRLVEEAQFTPIHDPAAVFTQRIREADAFYAAITTDKLSVEAASVHRQALAGSRSTSFTATTATTSWSSAPRARAPCSRSRRSPMSSRCA